MDESRVRRSQQASREAEELRAKLDALDGDESQPPASATPYSPPERGGKGKWWVLGGLVLAGTLTWLFWPGGSPEEVAGPVDGKAEKVAGSVDGKAVAELTEEKLRITAELKKLKTEKARVEDDVYTGRTRSGTPIEEVVAHLPPSGSHGSEALMNAYQEFFRSDRPFTESEKHNGFLRFGAGAGATVGEMRGKFIETSLEKFPKGELSEYEYREICANAFNAMFSANLLAASKEVPAAEQGRFVSVGLFGLAVFRNNPINRKAPFWYQGITNEIEPKALEVLKGEKPIRIQPGDAFGCFVADIVAGRRTFDALTGIDALAQDLDHIIREHPANSHSPPPCLEVPFPA